MPVCGCEFDPIPRIDNWKDIVLSRLEAKTFEIIRVDLSLYISVRIELTR